MLKIPFNKAIKKFHVYWSCCCYSLETEWRIKFLFSYNLSCFHESFSQKSKLYILKLCFHRHFSPSFKSVSKLINSLNSKIKNKNKTKKYFIPSIQLISFTNKQLEIQNDRITRFISCDTRKYKLPTKQNTVTKNRWIQNRKSISNVN